MLTGPVTPPHMTPESGNGILRKNVKDQNFFSLFQNSERGVAWVNVNLATGSPLVHFLRFFGTTNHFMPLPPPMGDEFNAMTASKVREYRELAATARAAAQSVQDEESKKRRMGLAE